jgi:dipeptidyl aminopeptidase/acylaminoacyl peptidase
MQTEMSRSRTNRTPLSRRELFPAFFVGTISLHAAIPEPRRITLRSSDGVSVYAWHYPATDKTLPAIPLFHQAGSNHAEYATIAPGLATFRRKNEDVSICVLSAS